MGSPPGFFTQEKSTHLAFMVLIFQTMDNQLENVINGSNYSKAPIIVLPGVREEREGEEGRGAYWDD